MKEVLRQTVRQVFHRPQTWVAEIDSDSLIPVSPEDKGASGNGVSNDTAPLLAALAEVQNSPAKKKLVLSGQYAINQELVITQNGVVIEGNSIGGVAGGRGAEIIQTAANLAAIRLSANYADLRRFKLSSTNTNTSAIRIAPANESQTTTVVDNSFNNIDRLQIQGFTEGIVLMAGPDVAGVDSGCFYNRISNTNFLNVDRAVWLKSPTNANGSSANRNSFFNLRAGSTGGGRGNIFIHVESGDTNTFIKCDAENILYSGPKATPTAFVVENVGPLNGASNLANRFAFCFAEACTRDLENANSFSEFVNCGFLASKLLLTALPANMSGYDPTQIPIIIGRDLVYQRDTIIAGLTPVVLHTRQPSGYTGKTGIAVDDTYGTFGFSTDADSYMRRIGENILGFTTGGIDRAAIEGGLKNIPNTQGTGPGGSLTLHDLPFAYQAGAVYLISRGAYDAGGTNYAHRTSLFFETSSGTFVEGTRVIDTVSAGTTFTTDTISRSSGNVRASVLVSRAATSFNNYASVIRVS